MYSPDSKKTESGCGEPKHELFETVTTFGESDEKLPNETAAAAAAAAGAAGASSVIKTKVLRMAADIEKAEYTRNVVEMTEHVQKLKLKANALSRTPTCSSLIRELRLVAHELALVAEEMERVNYDKPQVKTLMKIVEDELAVVAREMHKVADGLQRMRRGELIFDDKILNEAQGKPTSKQQQQRSASNGQAQPNDCCGQERKLKFSQIIEKFRGLEKTAEKDSPPVGPKKLPKHSSGNVGGKLKQAGAGCRVKITLNAAPSKEHLLDDQPGASKATSPTAAAFKVNADGEETKKRDGDGEVASDKSIGEEFEWEWSDEGDDPYTEDVDFMDTVEEDNEQEVACYGYGGEES